MRGRTVVVVDDGVASGGTARAALQTLRVRGASRLVLAVPIGTPAALEALSKVADEVVCLHAETYLGAVGCWYEDFTSVEDRDVVALLHEAQAERRRRARSHRKSRRIRLARERDVRIPLDSPGELVGRLTIPVAADGFVLFVHGAGGIRHDPRRVHRRGAPT